MKAIIIVMGILSSLIGYAQDKASITEPSRKLTIGINIGVGTSYSDKAFLVNFPASLTLDYKISKKYFVQFAPEYTWLMKWNEHYLTLPIHLRKKFGEKLSLFAGPALTFDVGHFKDLGISAGINYHFNKRSAITLSVFTFTLYDYDIDYLFIPIGLRYSFMVFK